jgi:hypothetical protein
MGGRRSFASDGHAFCRRNGPGVARYFARPHWRPIGGWADISRHAIAVCKRPTRRSVLIFARACEPKSPRSGDDSLTINLERSLIRAAFDCGDERGHAAASLPWPIGTPSRYRRRLVDGL